MCICSSNIWQIHLTLWEQVVWTHTKVGVFSCGWYENPVHPLTFALPCSALWVLLQCPCQESGCVNGAALIRLWHLFLRTCLLIPACVYPLRRCCLCSFPVHQAHTTHPYYFSPQVLVVGQDLVGWGLGVLLLPSPPPVSPQEAVWVQVHTYCIYPPFIPRPPEMTESEQTSLVYLLSCYISLSICHLEEIGHASYINFLILSFKTKYYYCTIYSFSASLSAARSQQHHPFSVLAVC